jgi:putative membrane protein
MMGNYWMGGFGWLGMILYLAISIGVIVGIVFLVIWLVKRVNGSPEIRFPNQPSQPSVDIIKARYAKGEISREEYQQLLSDIK